METQASGNDTRLTKYSHGSGCGCKIAPLALEEILKDVKSVDGNLQLLIGNSHSDDASITDIGDGMAVVSTTDFFMPIVDDPFVFGQIAAANALSDIYAMGGKPISALAILGWPVEQLGTSSATEVLKGARQVCDAANIALSGGHSIESKEPFFGLAVTGIISHDAIKSNNRAKSGDLIYLTKPLGGGIIATALKRGIARPEEIEIMTKWMVGLNKIGQDLGELTYVNALTDVTGFGLLGHLIEVCRASKVGASIVFDQVPLMDDLVINNYVSQFVMPDNTMRNFKAYSDEVSKLSGRELQILCDPQTSGGLIISIEPSAQQEFEVFMQNQSSPYWKIGNFHEQEPGRSRVEVN